IVLRENLLLEETKRADGGAEIRFTADELHGALMAHAAEPVYFCHYGLEWPLDEVRRRWMIYAVAQKPGGPKRAAHASQSHWQRPMGLIRRWISRQGLND
ncbi:MAG: hypothetical protein ABUU24_00770, partial [Variovorax sp.]